MKHRQPKRWFLTLLFSGAVFIIIFITMSITGTAFFLLNKFNILSAKPEDSPILSLLIFTISSLFIGTLIATIFSRIPLKPVHILIDGMTNLSKGNYDVKIKLGKRNPVGKEITKTFNLLASELSQTEVLRTDFVNNLSHEYKTPIVSILGFAKLLQKTDLTAEQQEFVDIIVTESSRLTNMTTNMLALSKIENQHILTDKQHYNVSEQIRECIILLEKRWSDKDLEIEADFGEFMINGNQELLKQFWINLMDNSIKYSYPNGKISFFIKDSENLLNVSVINTGPLIPKDIQKRIFNKYWQEDVSHSSEGTGIGLSISKKIIELHHGDIHVTSNERETEFIVSLPKE